MRKMKNIIKISRFFVVVVPYFDEILVDFHDFSECVSFQKKINNQFGESPFFRTTADINSGNYSNISNSSRAHRQVVIRGTRTLAGGIVADGCSPQRRRRHIQCPPPKGSDDSTRFCATSGWRSRWASPKASTIAHRARRRRGQRLARSSSRCPARLPWWTSCRRQMSSHRALLAGTSPYPRSRGRSWKSTWISLMSWNRW